MGKSGERRGLAALPDFGAYARQANDNLFSALPEAIPGAGKTLDTGVFAQQNATRPVIEILPSVTPNTLVKAGYRSHAPWGCIGGSFSGALFEGSRLLSSRPVLR